MNPRLAVIVVLPVLLRLHLRVTAAGTTVAVSLPWVIPVMLGAAIIALAVLTVRHLRGFRSSPYPRTVQGGGA
jgi:hypothetical protein